jgi:glycosyltransferase involved in cell wall biosynthesis
MVATTPSTTSRRTEAVAVVADRVPGPVAEPAPSPHRIAMLAPPWISVPPSGYGGIELVISLLCEGLVRNGHDVTLFACPGSSSAAEVREVLPETHEDDIQSAIYEVDHVARVFDAVDEAAAGERPYDIVHDHCGFTAVAMANRIRVPVVHTLHGPFTADTSRFYLRHGAKAHLVAISRAQRESAPHGLPVSAVVPNPIDVEDWPFRTEKAGHLLWLGRMTPVKGPDRAVAVARDAGVPLVLAGPVQPGDEEYFEDQVRPHVDGVAVTYVGEVGGREKAELVAGARALLMPIRWEEPFGMVMIEALACGTPVLAFPEGAAREIVRDGVNGFLVPDEDAMSAAVTRLPEISPAECRASVTETYSVDTVVAGYEEVYARVARAAGGRAG